MGWTGCKGLLVAAGESTVKVELEASCGAEGAAESRAWGLEPTAGFTASAGLVEGPELAVESECPSLSGCSAGTEEAADGSSAKSLSRGAKAMLEAEFKIRLRFLRGSS